MLLSRTCRWFQGKAWFTLMPPANRWETNNLKFQQDVCKTEIALAWVSDESTILREMASMSFKQRKSFTLIRGRRWGSHHCEFHLGPGWMVMSLLGKNSHACSEAAKSRPDMGEAAEKERKDPAGILRTRPDGCSPLRPRGHKRAA